MKLILETTKAYNDYKIDIIEYDKENKIDINNILQTIDIWKNALSQGYLPEDNSWVDVQLHNQILATFISLSLPRLVQTHQELLPSVIRGILQMIIDYYQRLLKYQKVNYSNTVDDYNENDTTTYDSVKEDLATAIGKQFSSIWGDPINGLSILDELYGVDHGLLIANADIDISIDDLSIDPNTRRGYGFFDGIWKHQGWSSIFELQKKLSEMPELKKMMRRIGRRISINGDMIKKSPPQLPGSPRNSPLGVVKSSYAPFEAEGIRASDSLTSLLPREVMLLIDSANINSSNRKRKLFNARWIEKQLLSYDRKGYLEEYSRPRPKPWKHHEMYPVQAGGPIIICLDTSFSMSGPRELIAKAVVLEASIMASKEHRPVYVLAFSGTKNIAEMEVPIQVTKNGLNRLLDFLGSSFNGGTDVTSPLLRAIDLIDKNEQWGSSDIVLVSDGELQMPPVDQVIMNKVNHLEINIGLEIHGLLVGRNSSVPLAYLCTDWDGTVRVYDFLCKFDPLVILRQYQANDVNAKYDSSSTSLYSIQSASSLSRQQKRFRRNFKLFATDYEIDSNDDTDIISKIIDIAQSKVNTIINQYTITQPKNTMDFKILEDIIQNLNNGLIERENECKLLLLAVLCSENIFLIGPPGTGKSQLAKKLSSIVKGRYFERLLTKFTNPEEVFGPLSLKALENDEYCRKVEGYLPTANVAFLDEIFKANSAILNSFLTILNERKFDNGNEQIHVPLLVTVAASNEIPTSDELEALYDRFLIRKAVAPVSDRGLNSLLLLPTSSLPSISSPLAEEFLSEIQALSNDVSIPQEVLDIIRELRIHLRELSDPPIYVSDRRLLKSVKLLKISAFTNSRSCVSLVDTLLLSNTLWYNPDERKIIRSFLLKKMIPEIKSYRFIYDSLRNTITKSLQDDLSSIISQISELESLASIIGKKIVSLRGLVDDFDHHLWISSTDLIQLRQQIGPQLADNANDLEKLMVSIYIFITALNTETSNTRLEILLSKLSTFSDSNDNNDNNDDNNDDDEILTSLELSYTKKEAMKLLSKDKYQIWKKKRNKKKKNDDDDDF